METPLKTAIETAGFTAVPALVDAVTVAELQLAIQTVTTEPGVRRRGSGVYAIRNLPQLVPEIRKLALSETVLGVMGEALGPEAFPVRGILFDKTPEANWHVGWHQDVTIAVAEKVYLPEYERWSEKGGVAHVQPPEAVLMGMLTLRLHLDSCNEHSGALRVVPGSHAEGWLDDAQIRHFRETVPPVVCSAQSGDALLMRPLLLHASSPATSPGHRRVIHLEYAAKPLPAGLQWPEF